MDYHPCVVHPVCFSLRPDDTFLAMELMAGGSLEAALHAPGGDTSWLRMEDGGKRVAADVAAGLNYLHTRSPPVERCRLSVAKLVLKAPMV